MSVEGKILPNAVDMEEAVLGAMMLDRNAIHQVIELLKPDTFYHDAHQLIYQAIKNLVDRTQPVDILTVTAELRQMGTLDSVGGAYYITRLTNRVSSAAHIEYHAHAVVQKYLQRELIRVSGEILKNAFEETADVFELLDDAEQKLFSIKDSNIKKTYVDIRTAFKNTVKTLEQIKENEAGLTGIPSGIMSLDRITGGWQKTDLIIIAARPSQGKTALALTFALNMSVRFDMGVGIFSLEMSTHQLVCRLISQQSNIPIEVVKQNKMGESHWQRINKHCVKLTDSNIFIDDTPAITVFDLRAKARRLVHNHDVKMIVVDYLQLMRGDKSIKNREQEISYISRNLKGLAKDLDIPVIALAQLSREVEKAPNKRPLLSHLRESGAIEQDADIVGFIYRPDYYGIKEVEINGQDMSSEGVAEIIIAKNRNGSTDSAYTRFTDYLGKFTDLNDSPEEQEAYNPQISMESKTYHPDQFHESPKDDLPF